MDDVEERDHAEETFRFLEELAERGGAFNLSSLHGIGGLSQNLLHAAGHREPVACRRGCSWCCHGVTPVNPSEVFLLASIVRGFPEERRRTVADRAARLHAMDGVQDPHVRGPLHLPCPLLAEDGACSVHRNRPLFCRSSTSVDAGLCEANYRDPLNATPPPEDFITSLVWKALLTGYSNAVNGSGLESGLVDLATALHVALQEGAEARWRGGEKVFEGLHIEPEEEGDQ